MAPPPYEIASDAPNLNCASAPVEQDRHGDSERCCDCYFLPLGRRVRYHLLPTFPLLRNDLVASVYTLHRHCHYSAADADVPAAAAAVSGPFVILGTLRGLWGFGFRVPWPGFAFCGTIVMVVPACTQAGYRRSALVWAARLGAGSGALITAGFFEPCRLSFLCSKPVRCAGSRARSCGVQDLSIGPSPPAARAARPEAPRLARDAYLFRGPVCTPDSPTTR
jgi:hypothetical protein